MSAESAGGRRPYGRKLHEEEGRLDTRVKISEIRRCWTLVSWLALTMSMHGGGVADQLGVELGQAGLPVVVKDQHGVYHVDVVFQAAYDFYISTGFDVDGRGEVSLVHRIIARITGDMVFG